MDPVLKRKEIHKNNNKHTDIMESLPCIACLDNKNRMRMRFVFPFVFGFITTVLVFLGWSRMKYT